MLPPLNLGSPDLQGGSSISSHLVTADASTLLKGAQASVSREEFLQALSHVLGQLDILWKHVQRLEKEVGGGGSSGKPSTPMPTTGGSSVGAPSMQTTHIPDMAPPPSRGGVTGSGVGNDSTTVSTPSSSFHPAVVGGFLGTGAAGNGRSNFTSSYYPAPDTLPELRAEDVRSLGAGGGIGGNSDVGLELRKGGFGHSPPPHAVSHLVNAHFLPPHGGSIGANNFSLTGAAGLSPSAHDELSVGVPLTISTANSQQPQQQLQASTRPFLTSSSTSVPQTSSSATSSLLYVGGCGNSSAVASNGSRVMNLSTEQDSAHDYISANLPNLSPISSRSSKMSKDGASGPMFGGDILPMTTDVRGISLWSADKSDPNIFPISPEPISRPNANSKTDRRGLTLASYCPASASSTGGGGVLNNLQLHDDSILLPPSSSDVAGSTSLQHHGNMVVNDGSSSASSSQNIHHVNASANLFSDQNDVVDLHGGAATTPQSAASTSAALASLQTQIDCIATEGAVPVSSQVVALPASSSSPFTFSTAGNQPLTPSACTTSTSLKNLPQLVDNSRRTLQLYPTSPLPDEDDLLNSGQRHNSSVSQPFSQNFALGGNSHFLTLSDLDAAVSAGSASVLLVSGNHHHSGGSGDGHPQTEAISPILPRGTLDTWVTMAPPQSTSSSSGPGNNVTSSQLADSFVPADMFVSAAAGNLGVSVPHGSCVCILCGHFVPQNQLEKHQCNGGGPATGLFGNGGGVGSGSGGNGGISSNNGGGTVVNNRAPNARSQSPIVPMNQTMLAPSLTAQAAPLQTTPISPSESPVAEGPPIAFHGRDISAHLLQSVGDYIPSSPPGSQTEHSGSGVIGLNIVAAGGVGNGSLSSSSPPGTPLSLSQQSQQQLQQQILTTRVSGGVSVTKMEPVFSVHSPPLPESMGSYQFSTSPLTKSASSLLLPLKKSTDRLLQIESVTLTDGQLTHHPKSQQEEDPTFPPPQRLDEQMALSPISVASSAGGNGNGGPGKKRTAPHVCNLCGKRFSKKWNLQLHQLTHSGKKPYVCRFCSKAFSRTNILKKHESTLHPNECSLQASASALPGTVSLPQPPPVALANKEPERTPSKAKPNRPKALPPQLHPLNVDPSSSSPSAERLATGPLLLRPVSPRHMTTSVEAKPVNHAIDVKKLKLLTQNLNNVTAITSTTAPTTTSSMTTATTNDHGNIFRDTIFKDVILKKDNGLKDAMASSSTSLTQASMPKISHRPSLKEEGGEKRSHDASNPKQSPPHLLGGTLLLNTIPASVIVSSASNSTPEVKASSMTTTSSLLGQPPAKRVLQQMHQQEKVQQLHLQPEKLLDFSQPPQLVLKTNNTGHSSIEISNQPLNLEKLNTSFMTPKSFSSSTLITTTTTTPASASQMTTQTPMLSISNSDPNTVPLKNLSTDFFYLKTTEEVSNSSLLSSLKAPTNDPPPPPPPPLQPLPQTSHQQQLQQQQSHLQQQQQLVLDASSRSFLLDSPRILSFNVAAANANAAPVAPAPNVEPVTMNDEKEKNEANTTKSIKNAVLLKRKDETALFSEPTASEIATSSSSNAKKYSCVECGKRFAWEKNLKVHLRSHTNEPKPYGCEFCSKRFTRRQHAKHHLMLQHAAEAAKAGLVISSSSAPTTTTTSPPEKRSPEQMLAQAETQRLVASIQRTNVFGCPVCRRAFSHRSEMEHHLTTHSNPKPHVCGICGKAFARKDNLKEHRLCVHPTATMTVIGTTDAVSSSAENEGVNPLNDKSFSRRPTPSGLSQEDATSGPTLEVALAVTQPHTSMRPVAS